MSADNPKLERLAASQLSIALSEQTRHEVADLVLRLHQRSARDAGAVLPKHMQRPYIERTETEQLGMRAAIQHVLEALLLLDLVTLRRDGVAQ